MKKLFVLVLALACVFSFASCGEETAYELYSNAVKALEEANGYEAEMKTTYDITFGEEKQSSSITFVTKQNGNDFYFAAKDSEILPFESLTYVDGVFYMNADGKKTKVTVSIDELMEEYKSMLPEMDEMLDLPELTEEEMKEIVITEEDGIRSFTVNLDKSDVAGLLGDMFEDAEMGAEATETNVKMSISFDKKGNLNGFKFDIEMSITVPVVGEMAYEITMEMTFKDLGKAPTISAPADAADYVEVEADAE